MWPSTLSPPHIRPDQSAPSPILPGRHTFRDKLRGMSALDKAEWKRAKRMEMYTISLASRPDLDFERHTSKLRSTLRREMLRRDRGLLDLFGPTEEVWLRLSRRKRKLVKVPSADEDVEELAVLFSQLKIVEPLEPPTSCAKSSAEEISTEKHSPLTPHPITTPQPSVLAPPFLSPHPVLAQLTCHDNNISLIQPRRSATIPLPQLGIDIFMASTEVERFEPIANSPNHLCPVELPAPIEKSASTVSEPIRTPTCFPLGDMPPDEDFTVCSSPLSLAESDTDSSSTALVSSHGTPRSDDSEDTLVSPYALSECSTVVDELWEVKPGDIRSVSRCRPRFIRKLPHTPYSTKRRGVSRREVDTTLDPILTTTLKSLDGGSDLPDYELVIGLDLSLFGPCPALIANAAEVDNFLHSCIPKLAPSTLDDHVSTSALFVDA